MPSSASASAEVLSQLSIEETNVLRRLLVVLAPALLGASSAATPDQLETESEAYRIEDFAVMIGVGRNTAYAAARAKEIPAIKVRGRYIVPKALARKFLNGEWSAPSPGV